MKSHHNFLVFILILCLIMPFSLLAQKEISITTSSEEALKLFMEGRDKKENIENNAGNALLDKAIAIDPDFAMAYIFRGGGKNIAKAVSLVDKVSEGEKHYILYSHGKQRKEHLDALLKLFPQDQRVLQMAAFYFRSAGNFPKSIEFFRQSIDLDKNFAPAYNNLGYTYVFLEEYDKAENIFKEYIKLLPDSPNPYDSYAELLMQMGRYDDSIEQYKKANDKDTLKIFGLSGIGHNYVLKGDFKKGREYYQKLYDKTPDKDQQLTALRLMATAYLIEGKIDNAMQQYDDYREFAKKEDRNISVIRSHADQGYIQGELGDPLECMKHMERVVELVNTLELPEGTKENYLLYSTVWKCYALSVNNKFEEAETDIKKAKNMLAKRDVPNGNLFLQQTIALLELKRENYDLALEHLSKSFKGDPFNIYYESLVHEKKGNDEKAAELLKKLSSWSLATWNYPLVRNRAMEKLKQL